MQGCSCVEMLMWQQCCVLLALSSDIFNLKTALYMPFVINHWTNTLSFMRRLGRLYSVDDPTQHGQVLIDSSARLVIGFCVTVLYMQFCPNIGVLCFAMSAGRT